MALVLTRGGSGDVVCSNRFEVGGLDEITGRQPMHKPSLQRVVDVGYDRKASRFKGNDQGHASTTTCELTRSSSAGCHET